MMIVEKVRKMIKERMLLMGKFGGGIKRQPQRRGKDRGILREYREKRLVIKSEIADHWLFLYIDILFIGFGRGE